MTPQEIEDRLLELGHELYKANEAQINSETTFLKAKAEYELEYDKMFLGTKQNCEGMTLKEAEAVASEQTRELRLKLIDLEAVSKHQKNNASTIDKKIGILQSIIKLRTSEMRSGL